MISNSNQPSTILQDSLETIRTDLATLTARNTTLRRKLAGARQRAVRLGCVLATLLPLPPDLSQGLADGLVPPPAGEGAWSFVARDCNECMASVSSHVLGLCTVLWRVGLKDVHK